MITRVAVAGFGAGALITAPIAESLISSVGVGNAFEILGGAYLVVVLGSAFFMVNPEGYRPSGFQAVTTIKRGSSSQDFTLRQALGTSQ
jgi:OFA family oxalate/formate antiporter-like MFS transporter